MGKHCVVCHTKEQYKNTTADQTKLITEGMLVNATLYKFLGETTKANLYTQTTAAMNCHINIIT